MAEGHPVFYLIAFFLGAVIGSFLNVCIVRIPQKKSIVSPPSHCPNCGSAIRPYDNIPILSYTFLRGRCRGCGVKIPFRYTFVEILTALLSVFLYLGFGPSITYLIYLLFVSSLVVITFIDLEYRIIPDVISLPGIVIGFLVSFIAPEIQWTNSILGILLGGGSLLLVAVVYEKITGSEGMGGGDVKLLAMIGAFLGWKGVLFTVMASSLFGTAIGGALMLLSGKGRKLAIPFGPFLSVGAFVYLIWGDLLISWYLDMFVYHGT